MNVLSLIPAKYRTIALIATVAILWGGFVAYIAWEKHKTKLETEKKVITEIKVETLEKEKVATEVKIEKRIKQNETMVRDISPAMYDSVWEQGGF